MFGVGCVLVGLRGDGDGELRTVVCDVGHHGQSRQGGDGLGGLEAHHFAFRFRAVVGKGLEVVGRVGGEAV